MISLENVKDFVVSKCKFAIEILKDNEKLEKLLREAEGKLEKIPSVGDKLANVPVLVSMLNSYFRKEYTDMSFSTLLTVIVALVYFVSPIDLILDRIPFLGWVDDALIISICYKSIEPEILKYKKWRDQNLDEIVESTTKKVKKKSK